MPIAEHKKIISIIENKEVDEIESVISQHIIEPTKLWTELENLFVDYFDYSL